MAVYKRGDVWWFDFTFRGERLRGTTYQRTRKAAEEYERQERQRVALGTAYNSVPTLRQAAAQWFRSRAERRKSVKTIAQRVKIMLRHMGDIEVTRIGTREIEAAIQSRRYETTRQGKAPTNGTINRDLIDSTLRPILRFCEDNLELPIRRINWKAVRLPEPKGRVRTFTKEEMAAWRAALPPWHRPVLDFMARYGVRLREAFFPPDAFDGLDVTIRERKNGLPLVVPLTERDVRDIAARASRAKAAGLPTVWFRETGGRLTPIHWRGFQSASKAALLKAGIEDARPAHDLRHHAASTAIRNGASTRFVQDLLGHESPQSTARYTHVDRADVRRTLRHIYATSDGEDEKEYSETKNLGPERTGT